MKVVNILVVEDIPSHQQGVTNLIESTSALQSLKIHAVTVATLSEAFAKYRSSDFTVDGVLSDVFFPEEPGLQPREFGTVLAEVCLEEGVPVVLVTSTDHHGKLTQPVTNWAGGNDIALIDGPVDLEAVGRDGEAPHKQWDTALKILMLEIFIKESGNIHFGEYYRNSRLLAQHLSQNLKWAFPKDIVWNEDLISAMKDGITKYFENPT